MSDVTGTQAVVTGPAGRDRRTVADRAAVPALSAAAGTLSRGVAVKGVVRLACEVLLHGMVLSMFVEGLAAGPISSGRVMAVLGAVAITVVVLSRPSQGLFPHPWVAVPAVLLTTWTIVTGIWATDRGAWLEAVLELALSLIFFVAFSLLVDSRAMAHRLLVGFAVGASLAAPVALAQVTTGARAVGLQGDPNTFALYQLAALPVVVFVAFRRPGWPRVAWAGAGVLLIGSVLASQSRGAFLGLAVITLWLLWNGARSGAAPAAARRLLSTVWGAVALGVAAVAAVTFLPRFDVVATLESGGTGRLDIWRTAVLAWWEQPLLGLGAGGYEPVSGQLLSQTPGVALDPYSVLFEGIRVHNSFLESLVEQGPLGLVLWISLLVGIGLLVEAQRRRYRDEIVGALVPMLLVFVAASLFLSVTANKLIWIMAGLAAVLPYLRHASEDDPAGALTAHHDPHLFPPAPPASAETSRENP